MNEVTQTAFICNLRATPSYTFAYVLHTRYICVAYGYKGHQENNTAVCIDLVLLTPRRRAALGRNVCAGVDELAPSGGGAWGRD